MAYRLPFSGPVNKTMLLTGKACFNAMIASGYPRATRLLFSFFAAAVLLGFTAQAQVGAVLQYDGAVTDQSPRAKPPAPALGPAGSVVADPAFGSRILRVSDANTLPGTYRNRSFVTPSSAEQNVWNADATIFYVKMGWAIPFSFDAATLRASRMGNLATSLGGLVLTSFKGDPSFSFNDPKLIYGLQSGHIAQYDFGTGQYTRLLELAAVLPGQGSHHGDLSVSATERLAVYFGGTKQDTDCCIVVWDKRTGEHAILDTARSQVKPFGASVFQPLASPLGWLMHNAHIDKSGRYVVITPAGGRPWPLVIWDTQTQAVTPVSVRGAGHKAAGFGILANQDRLPGDYGPQWLLRPLDPVGINAPWGVLPSNPAPPYWAGHAHLSWNNAQAGAPAPVVISTFHDYRKGATLMALEDEILAVRTDGVPTVWRFAHHRSVYEGSFWDSPRGNVSPDGRFFLFTSNWEKSLGPDPWGRIRQDVFLVELARPN
jgi:hypothetical protein